jgi:GTP-binding protein
VAHGGQALNGAGPAPATPDPESAPGPEHIAEGNRLFAQECRFVAGATNLDALPPIGLTEVAFAGRSNVGKSSLINALTGRRALARTSSNPGSTRQINFFDLGGRLMLVDLPGYGYAKVGKSEVRAWTDLMQQYLKGRPTLRRLCLLIDGRHGLKASDEEIMEILDRAAVVFQVVLTKCDKAGPGLDRLTAQTAAAIARHPAAHPVVRATSAESGHGIEAMRAALAALAPVDPLR